MRRQIRQRPPNTDSSLPTVALWLACAAGFGMLLLSDHWGDHVQRACGVVTVLAGIGAVGRTVVVGQRRSGSAVMDELRNFEELEGSVVDQTITRAVQRLASEGRIVGGEREPPPRPAAADGERLADVLDMRGRHRSRNAS